MKLIPDNKKRSVIITDDDSYYTWGYEAGIKKLHPDYDVAIATNGKELIEMLSKIKADVVIVDYFMPVMDGMQATRIIKEKYPEVKIIFASLVNDPVILSVILEAGVHAYVLKEAARSDMENAMTSVFNDMLFVSAPAMQSLVEYNSQLKQRERYSKDKNKLTDREIIILLLMIAGLQSKEIADKLSISEDTVSTHRHNIHSKTGAKTFTEITRYAILHGFISNLKIFTHTAQYVELILNSK
jgi:DNA-binding NarL/FixJ family response regulator